MARPKDYSRFSSVRGPYTKKPRTDDSSPLSSSGLNPNATMVSSAGYESSDSEDERPKRFAGKEKKTLFEFNCSLLMNEKARNARNGYSFTFSVNGVRSQIGVPMVRRGEDEFKPVLDYVKLLSKTYDLKSLIEDKSTVVGNLKNDEDSDNEEEASNQVASLAGAAAGTP